MNGSVSQLASFDASRMTFRRNTIPQDVLEPLSVANDWDKTQCTDHMVVCIWNKVTGWGDPELKPYGPFSMMPTASVLHYATECFEGMKVYRGYDRKLRLFRPDQNCKRMLASSVRICLPAFEPVELEKLIKALVAIEGEKWLPKERPGHFLYIRPAHIGSSAQLGLNPPKEAILFIIASCVPDPRQRGNGMKLLASQDDMVRAWPGGFGFAKVGANYGPSLIAHEEAITRGYDQILWLFGEDAVVTEAGASNFFVVWRTRGGKVQLVTAPLAGKLILDGITRRSVLEFARSKLAPGYGDLEKVDIVERTYYMNEVVEAIEEGRMIEAFAVGTAYFITPVSNIHFRGKDLSIPTTRGSIGEYANAAKSWLHSIMYGEREHEWAVVIEETEWEPKANYNALVKSKLTATVQVIRSPDTCSEELVQDKCFSHGTFLHDKSDFGV